MFVNVSEISSYVVCPRICYFRMRFGSKHDEYIAVKEIYFGRRKGLGDEWAKERFSELSDDRGAFERARSRVTISKELERLKPLDWELKLRSDRIKLVGILDELVEIKGKSYPLVLSLRSPKEGVWFKDRVKVTAFCMLLREKDVRCKGGYVYHCYDGVLRRVDVGRRDRLNVLKLVERVLRVKGGFLPEGVEGRICERCEYRESCKTKPKTLDTLTGLEDVE